MPRFDILKAKRDGLSDDDITAQIEEARAAGVDLYIDPTDAAAAQVVASTPAAPSTGEALGNAVAAPFRGLAAAMDFLAERGSRAAGGAIQGLTAPTEGAIPTPAEFAAPAVGYAKGLLLGQGPEASDEIRRLGWHGLPPEWQAVLNAGGQPVGTVAGAALSPEGLGTAASTIATLPLDAAGGAAMKGARALTKLPKVAGALDVLRQSAPGAAVARAVGRPGATLPHEIREPVRDLMREARGGERLVESKVKDVLDEAQAAIMQVAKEKNLPPEVAERWVRDMLEMSGRSPGLVAAASPSEQAAVMALQNLATTMPQQRAAAGLRPSILGSHLTPQQAAGNVEFSPRIPEDKAAEALGLDPGVTNYSALAASVPGIRTANRQMTTTQLEAAIQQATGYQGPVFKPLLESFEIAGQGTARATANAKALTEIAARFSMPAGQAPPNYRAMSRLGIFEGFDPNAAAVFSNAHVHPELYGFLQDFTRETTPQKLRVMSGFLKVWKPAVTTLNPQFVSRNMQWNAIIGWIRGNRNPGNWVDAGSVLGRANGPPIAGLGARAALRDEMIGQKIIGTGTGLEFGVHAGRRLSRDVGTRARGALAGASQVNQAGEDLSRAAHYIAMRRNGMSPSEAAAEVARTYFDYTKDAFTPFENKLRENLIPFYAWTRNILPLTFRTLIEKPSGFAGLGAVSRESARAAGLPLEDRPYMGAESRDVLGVTIPPYPGEEGFRTSPMSQVGFFDTGRFSADPAGAAVQQLTPLISVPAQVAGIIKNPLTGKEAEDIVALPPAAALIPAINPELAAKWGITLAAPGRAVGPERVNALFRTGGPLGTALIDIVNTEDPDAQLRAYSWLSGIRVRKEVDPQVGRSIQQRRERSDKRDERYRTGQRQRLSGQIEAGQR